MDKRNLYIRNATIYTEKETLTNGNVLIEKGKIKAIFRDGEKPAAYPPSFRVIDGEGLNLIPGFIDGHIHGANGADVMDATEEAIDKIASVLPKEGTTSFLATTITQSKDNIEHALKNISHYPNKPGYAEVIGIHLEGPFLEVEKKGAQPAKYILEPDMELFDSWQALSGNKIKTITMAPEHDPNGDFIRHLSAAGINVSAGHTNANFDQMKQAVAHGVRQVTHICNAMNGIHHRDIGAVGAALQLKELRAELIADGIHVAPEMIDLIYRNMGSERLILITDAMRAKCLHPGDYELGGQPVEVTEDRAILEDGTLAGSILKLVNGAKQVYRLQDVSIRNIIEMASENPAKQIHVFDRKGSITVGKDADILLVDDELNIHHTICQGIISYEEE